MSATELHQLRESIIIDLNALLLSSKDGLTERELLREYKILNGIDVQFTRLGYNSFYDFLQSLVSDSVLRQSRRYGNLVVYFAIEKKCTYELRQLVCGQRDTKIRDRDQRRYRF